MTTKLCSFFMILLLASCTIFVSSCKDDDDDHDHDHDTDATLVYHAHIMSPDTTDKNVGDEYIFI